MNESLLAKPMSDRSVDLIQTMQVYFAFKGEMKRLKDVLEHERQVCGETIATFYDARRNVSFAFEITRFAECRKQMDRLLIEAEETIEDLNAASDMVANTSSETGRPSWASLT
ncbi:hypothetical protein RHSP_65106 [Rhizobium freirei PRF 81]|uniref:Uncharacterized protein n=1 Tax=Rhizobium freirei PRF 81 TaxID=363754 RepID=N6V5Y1_9HYPH|nr:hypothetical protein [Rhizobium freirei]ENN88556.1 hypothetical protein RHSP_65106 [Rhizobium freirei PRF 81]